MQISDPVRPSPHAHISAMLVVDPRHEGRTQIQKYSYNRTGVACRGTKKLCHIHFEQIDHLGVARGTNVLCSGVSGSNLG